jgi:hypothetical protein
MAQYQIYINNKDFFMAKYSNVKDSFSGKVGSLVYSSWRGIKYVKVYSKPSNPRTEKQQGVRSKFKALSHIGKSLHAPLLKPYTFPKPQKLTAYNVFLHINKGMFEGHYLTDSFDPKMMKIFDGPLYNPTPSHIKYEPATKELEVQWTDRIVGPAKGTDIALVVAIQNEQVLAYDLTSREAKSSVIDLSGEDITPDTLYVYLVFIQPPGKDTNESGMVSVTNCHAVGTTMASLDNTEAEKKPEKKG